jgi:TPR repeat protein
MGAKDMKRNTSILLAVSLIIVLLMGMFIYEKAFKNKSPIDEIKVLANQGDHDAQNKLGAAYYNGTGVEKNMAEAARWFRQAAEKGYAKAQHNLGIMYYVGEGVPHDEAEAVKWFSRAAEQGLAAAQHNLGVMYHQGKDIPKDPVMAFMWLSLASEQKYEEAIKYRNDLTPQMTPAQLEEARTRARDWKPNK